MNYRVCILAAGVGSRMGALSQHVNKAILPVNFKGTISYIIEKFPKDTKIVIAIGHKKESIIEYLVITHPDRSFIFVDIDKYIGPGSGPGYSLLQCKKALQCPFIFFAADTIVLEEIPLPDKNWFGIAPIKDPEKYCTVKIKNNFVYEINDKIKTNNRFAFIGLAGIYDYKLLFSELEKNKDLISEEIQVSNGFKRLIEKKLVPIGFTWFDTGSINNYIETNKNFSGNNVKLDINRGDEFLYFINDRVIKYFADPEIVRKRCERADTLKGLCPKIESRQNNFYAYKKVNGQTLSNILDNQLLNDFLYEMTNRLWKKQELTVEEQKIFFSACKTFYYNKIIKRLQSFYNKTGINDCKNNINGVSIPSIKELFAKIDWDYICTGIPVTIHGDLQFDNVLLINDNIGKSGKFLLLDWREDFSGLTNMGDIYYDLAKIYESMIFSYEIIKENMFSFDMSGTTIHFDFYIKNNLLDTKEIYENFIAQNGFDLQKIKIITGINLLETSVLYHDPVDHLLFFLGKTIIYKTLMRNNDFNNL